MRGCSLAGRALPLHGRGQGFESPHLHQSGKIGRKRKERGLPVCTSGWGGDYSERETPVPIPNTAVKPFSPDYTWGVTPRENRTLPLHPPVWAGFYFSSNYWNNDVRIGDVTAKLSRKDSTASWSLERRSSRLRAGDCVRRPFLPACGGGSGGLA